jgi:hypothetical protein
MTRDEHLAKAISHMELAIAETNVDAKNEHLRLALSYMRLAELATKNAASDLIYEPPMHVQAPVRAVPQQQQQQIGPSEPSK